MNQLSTRQNFNGSQKLDAAMEAKKQDLIMQVSQMGCDLFRVQDFLEQKGIWQNEINLLLDIISMDRDATFINPLKISMPPPSQPMMQPNWASVPGLAM